MHCILLESRRHRGTATVNSDGVLLIGVKDRLLNVSQRYKTSVRNAQSWAGCTLPSDHRLVAVGLLAPKQHGYRRRNTNKLTIDTNNLIDGRDLQKEFAVAVALTILAVPLKESSWNEFGAVLQKVTKEKIKLQLHRQQRRRNALEDPEVKVLMAEVRKLSMDENAAQMRS